MAFLIIFVLINRIYVLKAEITSSVRKKHRWNQNLVLAKLRIK